MLVLVAGATGNVGQKIVTSLLSQNHQVRILARNPSKLPSSILTNLESCIQTKTYYDTSTLDLACSGGVSAIICAYSGVPTLSLDCQLLLLRAAERAGIKKFIASSWNYNWSAMNLGEHESYDSIIAFHRQVELTSDIKPVYV